VTSEPDLEQFFRAAEDLLAEHGPGPDTFARIGTLLRPLAADPTLLDPSRLAALHNSTAGFTVLGHGKGGSTLMLGRFRPDAPTPVHNQPGGGAVERPIARSAEITMASCARTGRIRRPPCHARKRDSACGLA
jgi:hypothetical protein